MKKIFLLNLLFISSLAFGNVQLDNVDYTIDTINRYQAGPGTWYTQLRLLRASDGQGRKDVYVLSVDRANPYIHYHTVLGQDKLIGTERPSAMAERKTEAGKVYFAGTNGDFYDSDFRGFKTGVPDGTFITERTIAHTPMEGREPQPSAIVDSNNRFYFGRNLSTDVFVIRQNGDSMRCNHVNYDRLDDELVLYNTYNGTTTLTTSNSTEVVCQIGAGQSFSTNGTMLVTVQSVLSGTSNTAISPGCIVLSAEGNKQSFLDQMTAGEQLTIRSHTWIHTEGITDDPGSYVDYTDNYVPRYDGVYDMDSISTDFLCAFGGQDKERFLINGVVLETWAENHPRTAVGTSLTGDTIFQVVVDGRGVSTGATLGQMGQLMRYLGAYNAINLEGGGSSAMYIRNKGLVNNPSGGSERAESNGLFVVCEAPEDNTVAKIVPSKNLIRLPQYGYTRPQFFSYNQYDLMLSSDEQDITLMCDSSVGYIRPDGRTFVAVGDGVLTARCGAVETTIQVSVDGEGEVQLGLDSILIDARTNYPIELSATVDGTRMGVLPSALNWSFDQDQIAEVSPEGVLNGVSNGRTVMHGSLGSFSDDMQVTVEIPSEPSVAYATTADTTISYSSVRNCTMKFPMSERLYSRPDSLRITFLSSAAVSELVVTLRAAGQTDGVMTVISEEVPANEEYVYTIPISDLMSFDQSIYPLTLERLRWTIKGAQKNTPYRTQIKRIETVYNHFLPTSLRSVTSSSDGDSPQKILRNGVLYIRLGEHFYTILGVQVDAEMH